MLPSESSDKVKHQPRTAPALTLPRFPALLLSPRPNNKSSSRQIWISLHSSQLFRSIRREVFQFKLVGWMKVFGAGWSWVSQSLFRRVNVPINRKFAKTPREVKSKAPLMREEPKESVLIDYITWFLEPDLLVWGWSGGGREWAEVLSHKTFHSRARRFGNHNIKSFFYVLS